MKEKHGRLSLAAEGFERDCIAWGESLCLACLCEMGGTAGGDPAALRVQAAEQWAALRAREMDQARAGESLALSYLAAAFSLEEGAYQCLILSVLPLWSRRFVDYYERLEPPGRGALTVGLALWLLEGSGTAESLLRVQLREEGSLTRFCFERQREEARGLCRVLRPDRRIESLVLFEEWNCTGCAGLELVQTAWREFPSRITQLATQMEHYLSRTHGEYTTFLLAGQRGVGRRTLAAALAEKLGGPLLRADGRRLLMPDGGEFVGNLLRECMVQRCPVCVTGLEELLETLDEEWGKEETLCTLLRKAAEYGGCSILVSERDWAPAVERDGWRVMPVELPLPTLEESRELWKELLGQYPTADGTDPEQLAGTYHFTPGQIKKAVERARAEAAWQGHAVLDGESITRGCRSQLRHALGEKACKVERLFVWEDLILPEPSKQLLRSACDQIRYRHQVYEQWGFDSKLSYGKGLSMLFAGPPGTGKTMAAQIAAGELGLELYKVELPVVVSKYVGETEKNLNQIFREAEKSQAILFFDEADVLFGKRTEVKDAHDKYNNMEAAFLLQKMEEYSGVSILATNFLQNFDEAFKRRIKFMIEFPFPNERDRQLLWQSVFPVRTPLECDVDWEYLARSFELSGSGIKNVAVNAAFLAAGEGKMVGMTHLLKALCRELHKSGKTLTREDFGEYYMLLEQE